MTDSNKTALLEAVRLLRDAGHPEAASDLALSVMETAAATQTDEEPPAPTTPSAMTGQEQIKLQGDAMLAELRRQLPKHPALDES